MQIHRAYKTELKLTKEQQRLCEQHAGAARFAYNWGLERKQQAYRGGEKTPTAIDLHRELNKLKKGPLAWLYETSKCAPQEALRNLDDAFKSFFRRCKQKVRRKGFPKFKSKRRCKPSFRLNGTIKVFQRHLQLPRLGKLKVKEASYLPIGIKILSATVSNRANRWFVSLLVEEEIPNPPKKKKDIVGVDLGVKTLAVCSDGKNYGNLKPLDKGLSKLRKVNKALSRKQKGSHNRQKSVVALQKLHYKIACARKDLLHKVSTALTRAKSCLGIEDLSIASMMHGKIARHLADSGLAELKRILEYKAKWYGCTLVVADRFFPSSKCCHSCGYKNDSLELRDRTWTCHECGTHHDRDFNASMNLYQLAVSSTESINVCGDGSADLAR